MSDSMGDSDLDGDDSERPRRWTPATSGEISLALRKLALTPWLIAGRHDDVIGAVRRNQSEIRDVLARLGWVLIVERDFVRLRKSPPVRRDAWALEGATAPQATWFFLLVAAAESMAPRVGLSQIVSAARSAAAETGLPVTHDMTERRAIVHALKMLDTRGVVMEIDGKLDGFVDDESAQVLLEVHHARLCHVIANYAPLDPVECPEQWMEQVERETDAARRMRRRLVDDTVVHVAELDEGEADWLSKRVRSDDGGPLAEAFGLSVERRSEGAAFVVPNDAFRHPRELGHTPFPATGTVQHAALLLCGIAIEHGLDALDFGGPGAGWRGLAFADVKTRVSALAMEHAAWRQELTQDPQRLEDEALAMLWRLNLVKSDAMCAMHWFSPAVHRWNWQATPRDRGVPTRTNAGLFES